MKGRDDQGEDLDGYDFPFCPSANWATGGPLLSKYIGNLWKHNKLTSEEPDVWAAVAYLKAPDGTHLYYEEGPTELVAVMRTIVSQELGDEVEIPKELL